MPETAPETVLTVAEAAQRLGVHKNTLKRLPPEELPFFRFGTRRDRRYHASDIDEYIAKRMIRES